MVEFILNDQKITTELNQGVAMLDFIRKHRQLTGSKLVCKEGECGACTVMVGSLHENGIFYQSMTSCIMPLANAHGKHILTIEGLNMDSLTPIQQAMVDQFGTQCGFCTPGFVVSLTGYLLNSKKPDYKGIIGAIDGNICRCTGYKSIERAAMHIVQQVKKDLPVLSISALVKQKYIPEYLQRIPSRLKAIAVDQDANKAGRKLGGGTDLYVQRPIEMYEADIMPVYDQPDLKTIEVREDVFTFGASLTMGDLYRSPEFAQAIPHSEYIFKLLSSTQIRNMATIGGNLVNASPIGDFTIILLALNSAILLDLDGEKRTIYLKDFYKDYKVLDLQEGEIVEKIQFKIPAQNAHYHFEKVSQRKYFDIASVNLASLIEVNGNIISDAHFAIGGVGPIPLYLKKVSEYVVGKIMDRTLVQKVLEILQKEISPISDARGSAQYKRRLARQLLLAQFLQHDAQIFEPKDLIGA